MDDHQRRRLRALAEARIAQAENDPWSDGPGIHTDFHCTNCGSNEVRKISAIIDSSASAMEIDGKTVPLKIWTKQLRRWNPGPKPRAELELVAMALVLAGAGIMLGRALEVIPFIVVWIGASGLVLLYWERRQNLGARLKSWMELRTLVAKGWHCRQCGSDYIPPALEDLETMGGVLTLEGADRRASASNVNPLHKG